MSLQPIFANYTATVSEFQKGAGNIIKKAGDHIVALLSHNKTCAYIVPAVTYHKMMAKMQKLEKIEESLQRLQELQNQQGREREFKAQMKVLEQKVLQLQSTQRYSS